MSFDLAFYSAILIVLLLIFRWGMVNSNDIEFMQYSNIPLIIIVVLVIINVFYNLISFTCNKLIFNNEIKQVVYNGKEVSLNDIFAGTILVETFNEYKKTYLKEGIELYQIKDNLYKTYDNIIKPYLQMIKQNKILNNSNIMTVDKALNYGIKQDVIPIICSCVGDMQWKQYPPQLLLNNIKYEIPNEISESLILHYFNYAELDDFITGKYKNLEYKIIEGRFYDKNKYTSPIFQGTIGVIETNKFMPHTVIQQRIITPTPWILNNKKVSIKKINSEELNLGNKYSIASNDILIAQSMLTPSFIARLDNLQAVFNATEIRCTFYQDKFVFALYKSNNDFFEPISTGAEDILSLKSLHDQLDNADKNFYRLFDELLSVFDIMDELEINH